MDRRAFLELATLGTGAAAIGCAPGQPDAANAQTKSPVTGMTVGFGNVKPMTDGIVPILDDERRGRIAKAQKLMAEQKIDAIFLEGTASCFYFANMRWGQSERTFGVVIPAKGELAYVCPGFEEDRARELIKFGNDVRTWEEDESPYKLIVQIVKDRGVQHRRIGMEERVRFFIADGVRKEAAGMEIVDASGVTAGCRIYKSPAEIALMQRAMDVTIEAYKLALATLREGLRQNELADIISRAAFEAMKLGAPCESVDAAARKVIVDAGFGPGYKTPGLPHRTGHGIGLEGHEWTNFVKGNKTPLAPGMCFSDEPMVAIPGEFGIRLEDCVYFTDAGARFFTKQSLAIDKPFG
jgi:Xaa-Pro aminopeptidase